jgi:hypothetical protein
MAKIVVAIENPLPGGRAETTRSRARRFVRAGRAVFIGEGELRIRFVEGAARVAQEMRATTLLLQRTTGRAYDLLGGNYIRCARHIPVLHPEKMRV